MSENEVAQHARLVFIGTLLFVIAYQLWVARMRRSEPVLYIVAAWATAALAMVAGRAVQHATDDPTTVIFGSRIFHSGAMALVPLGFLLMHELRGAPKGRIFRACMVVSAVPVFLVWTGNLIVSDQTQAFKTLTGTILGPRPAPLGPLALPYLAAIAAYLVHVARRGRRDLHWHQRLPLQVAMLLLLPALVNDVLLYAGKLVTIELAGVGLFAHVMAINVGIFARAGQLFSQLEREVDERTAELRSSERELSRMLSARRKMLDAIPDTVCLLNGSRLDYVNEAGARFFGRGSTELAGSEFTLQVVKGQALEAERGLSAIAASSEPATPVELRFKGENGERAGEVAGLMLELDDGPRTLITIRDVTERKRLMAKLQTADRLASVGTLAAGVAHEINNPLTFIVGNLDLMKRAVRITPELAAATVGPDGFTQLVDECLTGSERIVRIVRDLRLFARADDESAVLEVPAILDQALKMAMVTIRHRAEVTTDYSPVPSVKAAAGQLAQVFLNLLINASQAIPDDGTEHSIRVSTSTSEDGRAVIEIADTGAGIDPAVAMTIFDPFVTTKPAGTGMGLGLFICRGIVTALGGDIRLLPREPRGTIAQVTLPAAEAAAAKPPSVVQRSDRTEQFQRGRIRVLIADDEEIALRVLRRQLHEYLVTTVASGSAAIERLEAEAYDVVLCDLSMPGCNGMEVWKRAKELGYQGRFVLMTGGAATEALQDLVDRAHVPRLMKPVPLADLEAAIHAAVARGRQEASTK